MKSFKSVTEFGGEKYVRTMRQMKPTQLIVDNTADGYQREEKPSHIQNIVKHFNPLAVKPFAVNNRNGKGAYYVMDGQQELAAVRTLITAGKLPENHLVDCWVTKLPLTEEAKLFTLLNASRHVTPGEKFKARVASGDVWAIQVKATLEKHDMTFSQERGRPRSNVVPNTPLNYIEKKYGLDDGGIELLDTAIGIAKQAWTVNGKAFHKSLNSGLWGGLVDALREHKDTKPEALAERLKWHHYSTVTDALCANHTTHSPSEAAFAEYFSNVFKEEPVALKQAA